MLSSQLSLSELAKPEWTLPTSGASSKNHRKALGAARASVAQSYEALRVDDEVVVFEGLEELVETELFFRAALRLCIIDFVGDGGGERKGLGVDGAEAGGGGFEAHGKEISDGLKLRRKEVTPRRGSLWK